MNFESFKNRKSELTNTAQALGGMATAEVGIGFIETSHTLGGDIVATPAILVGLIVAVKGAERLLNSLLGVNIDRG